MNDLEWWLDLAPTLNFRTAKTMPTVPHSYIVRDEDLNREDFARAVEAIRIHGEPGKFNQRTGIYLTHDDVKWWTQGAPIEGTWIINQASTEIVYGEQDAPSTFSGIPTIYDELANEYDERYISQIAQQENETVRKHIMELFPNEAPHTLDVGCGTGLLLDLYITSPAIYTGVDPSQGMLNQLVMKHPTVKDLHPDSFNTMIGDFTRNQFQLSVALFGVASYLTPTAIEEMVRVTSGAVVFMAYREGYLPDYYVDQPEPPNLYTSRAKILEIGGEPTRLNDMDVTTIHV